MGKNKKESVYRKTRFCGLWKSVENAFFGVNSIFEGLMILYLKKYKGKIVENAQ